jgi:uncharacterized membrane protein YeaQ/YmgE (transglycosylase-associated protein family)
MTIGKIIVWLIIGALSGTLAGARRERAHFGASSRV